MEMAKYIYLILKSQLMVMWSWGFNSPIALSNGLKFNVEGFRHNGSVSVVYNAGTDLFNIILHNYKQMGVEKIAIDVPIDKLVDVIDRLVEKTDDYENRIKQEYSLIF